MSALQLHFLARSVGETMSSQHSAMISWRCSEVRDFVFRPAELLEGWRGGGMEGWSGGEGGRMEPPSWRMDGCRDGGMGVWMDVGMEGWWDGC